MRLLHDRLWLLHEMVLATLATLYCGSNFASTMWIRLAHWPMARLYPTPHHGTRLECCDFYDGMPYRAQTAFLFLVLSIFLICVCCMYML